MRRAAALGACLGLLAMAAEAQPPQSSLRPVARGEAVVGAIPQPEIRPRDPAAPETVGVTPEVEPRRKFRLFGALRPRLRSDEVEKQGRARAAMRAKGAVCGDPDIQGVEIGRVPGPIAGCGIDSAVRVSSVMGVGLSTHAMMDCGTAKALKSWVKSGLNPAMKKRGGVAELQVAAHYACRTRNNQKGERVSEHGKGRAIDIAGMTLRDGTQISVLTGWPDRRDGPPLRKMHAAACGPFGTVLGPDANAFHRDHFHFDTARYRSGSYCR